MYALYLAYQDPRVPWYAKALSALVVAYALSPIDLIPDFLPIVGYLDDILLVPLGIALVIRMIPEDVMREYLQKAEIVLSRRNVRTWPAVLIVVFVWAAILVLVVWKITAGLGGAG